jgi:hypothetical protein
LQSAIYNRGRQINAGNNNIDFSGIATGETVKVMLWQNSAMEPLIIPVSIGDSE